MVYYNLDSINENITDSLNLLDKKHVILCQEIKDNNPKIQEKLNEILERMGKYKKKITPLKKLVHIDKEFIRKKVENVDKSMNGVFNYYVKNLIVQTVNVWD